MRQGPASKVRIPAEPEGLLPMNLATRRPPTETDSNGLHPVDTAAALAVARHVEDEVVPAPVPKPVNTSPSASLDEYAGDPNFMTSLARGLLVIQSFSPQTPQMTISQLSVKTGLSRAAVRRCLYRLT